LENAGLQPLPPEIAARTAIVFGATDGSVVYTRKFYEQIARQGANAASPLLFPETVYNAPASHLAAQLGIDGASYTLVGDSSVGFAALKLGEQLLALGEADYVVVVGCEELDWILCEAYADWRLARTPLAEGAGAVVLSRETGRFGLEVHGGETFFRQREASDALARALRQVVREEPVDVLVSCASRTFLSSAEKRALRGCAPAAAVQSVFTPKHHFGEMLGASGLVHVIFAALALERQARQRALVPIIGFNQQADAAIVSRC
jgi:3-oxoacyl-(acyl-carrier-protein) synthase